VCRILTRYVTKREEVARGWRRMHNEELRNLYASPNVIRVIKSVRMTLAGHVESTGAMKIEFKILVGKPEWRRPRGRQR
jgi:hypothetical protein